MGRIGRLIQTAMEKAKAITQTVEVFAGKNITAETFAPSGDDSPPLPDDRIVLVQTDGTGNFVAVGVLSVSQGAKPGERILYSRNDKGEVQAAIRLLNDGAVEVQTFGDKGFVLKDKAGNMVESSKDGGLKLTDCKGGTVTMAGTITLTGKNKGKVEIS